jgi:hypothetical protein
VEVAQRRLIEATHPALGMVMGFYAEISELWHLLRTGDKGREPCAAEDAKPKILLILPFLANR